MPVRSSHAAWQGEVVQVTGATSAIVRIPRLVGGQGGVKCRLLEGWWTAGEVTDEAGGPDPHVHGVPRPLEQGDQVLVLFLEGRDELAVIIGRLLQ